MFKAMQRYAGGRTALHLGGAVAAPRSSCSHVTSIVQRSIFTTVPDALSHPVPNASGPVTATFGKMTVTTLPNGARIMTETHPYADAASVGAFIKCGADAERPHELGVSHFVDRLWFHSTTKRSYEDSQQMFDEIGTMNSIAYKQGFLHEATIFEPMVPKFLELICDSLRCPQFTADEVEMTREFIQMDIENQDDKMSNIDDLVSSAAYTTGPGNPLCCSKARIKDITREEIVAFTRRTFIGKNISIGAMGLDHATFVSEALKAGLGDIPAASTDPSDAVPAPPVLYDPRVLQNVLPAANNPVGPRLSRVAVGFKAPFEGQDLVVVSVIRSLLGGGSAFMSGGPGKGLYSRLYLSLVSNSYVINDLFAQVYYFEQGGIFYLWGSVTGSQYSHTNGLQLLVDVMAKEFKTLVTPGTLKEEELQRAKNMLKSNVLMNLEQKPMCVEDMLRQSSLYDKRYTGRDVCAAIDKVTADDMRRVALEMLQSEPCSALVVEEGGSKPNLAPLHTLRQSVESLRM